MSNFFQVNYRNVGKGGKRKKDQGQSMVCGDFGAGYPDTRANGYVISTSVCGAVYTM